MFIFENIIETENINLRNRQNYNFSVLIFFMILQIQFTVRDIYKSENY